MAQPTNESGLVAAIVKAVLKKYPDVWGAKIHGGPYQVAGIPDLLFCVDGLFVGMEVKFKRPGESEQHARGRATPGQRAQIAKINAAGGIAAVVLSAEEALDLIRRAYVKQEAIRGRKEHS